MTSVRQIAAPSVADLIPDDVSSLLDHPSQRFTFPSAVMVDAAAALFPRPDTDGIVDGWYTRPDSGESSQYRAMAEGAWPRLEIAPGLVRFTRVDRVRRELTAERALQSRFRDEDMDRAQLSQPMAFALLDTPVVRAPVTEWSAKSRARMVSTILELDLAEMISSSTRSPVMVTLTLPGDWLAVTPTAAVAAAKFDNFCRAWSRRWGASPSWIWKREFQRRGAPHWHIWTIPPTHNAAEFREWLSATWTRVLDIQDAGERARSLRAGTGVDSATAMRSRDPKRLAVYFLKESLGGTGKAYQNAAPFAWVGQSVGRFWGVRGLDKALRSVPLPVAAAAQVWRAVRKLRTSGGVTRQARVPRGFSSTTGEIRFRTVRRSVTVRGSAGWVAVNSGTSVAASLARYVSRLLSPPPAWSTRSIATMPA